MRSSIAQLTMTALVALCIINALAVSHVPDAAADTFGLSIAEYTETTSGSDDNPPPEPEDVTNRLTNISSPARQHAGLPGIPHRALEARYQLTRFPRLPQGPPYHA
ncbi:hypothetical protein [Vreelandella utahensis]|uniref:hypothetical protein n=1 Tax=Vreelandella halophila TaxID=86177 RepID=UPI0009873269|nr:hypothetical protein [Halomonas utahensis]